MSANENTTKICVFNNDQSIRDAREIGVEANNKAIVKYEEKDKAIICEKCTILKNLKDTITHICHTTVKNVPDESELYQNVRNFCELDIINNLYNAASQDNCVNCRKLKSETNVMSSHGQQKHKHKHMKRSESQIDNRSKISSSTSGLQRKSSRTSRSLSRNAILYDNNVNPSDTSKEEVLKWKNEIETLEIKRQVFTAIGENKSKGFRSSRDKEKSSKKQQKKKADTNETNEFNAPPLNTNFTENKLILMNEDCPKIDDKFPKKDVEDLMKIKTNRSSKKKRNNSPNVPIQPHLELVKKNLKEKMSPVPQDLINFINIDLKETMSPKLIRLYGKESTKQRSVSKSKKKVDKEDANVNNIIQYNDKRNENDFDKSCDKEIIDIFKKDDTVIDEVVTNKVKAKHKDKEEHKIRKHRKKEQTEKCDDNICSRHSNSSKKIVDKVKIDEELNKATISPNTLLLFGVDYLINSQALQKEAEESSENGSCVILNANREELPLKDRKEMSISNLNLSPIIDHYARNKPIIDSIFYQAHKKRHLPKQSQRSRKSDDLSIISDAVTSKEKSLRRHRQDRARHYFGSQAKCTRLINQTTNHMVSDENLIEVSTKTLANDIIKSSVEGIEPPRRIVNKAFHRKSNITALKHNCSLHMTFLEPVAFPAELETLPPQAPSAEDNNLSEGDKVEVVQSKVGMEVLPLKHCPSRERKSKISVLYEHRSNSARRKELRNKLCNHQRSKQNFVKSRGKPDERQQSVQKVCTNPDLVRRVPFARNSIKSKCSKCQGTKRDEKNDKSICANVSGVTNEFVNKNKKLPETKSSKKMCTVDTQTDLLDYKNIATTDHISQTTEVKNVNKRSSPIMIGVPGVHKSDTNVLRKEYVAAPNKSKPSAYQKLQSVVLSLFENAKDSYGEEIDGISQMANKNDSNINSKLPNNSTIEENDTKTLKNTSITPPGPPNSPISPQSAIKLDVFSARIKSGIPKPTKKSLDKSRDSSLSDSKPKDGNLSKSVLGRDKQQNDGASNSLDLNVLKDCIEDLISVLNGIKEKPPKDLVLKNHHARKADELPEDVVPDEVKRLISSDTCEKLVKKKRPDKRQALNVLSSTSADSNRDSNLSCKRKSQRRKSKKLSRHQLVDERTLKSVFKNKNCHGSDSLTQFSSSGTEFRNVIKEKGALNDELETLKEFFYKNNVTHHNDNEFTKPLGVGTLLVEETMNVENDLHPELLRNLPKPKTDITTLQKAEGSAIDYNHVMEQLVYMFTQKPPPKNEGIVNAGNQTSSSNFSADSLEQSYKYEPANSRNMPPKNCNFFVYTSTIELDKDMKKNLAENNNLRSFATFMNQNKLNSYSNISNTTSKSSYTVSSTSSGYGTGKKSASLKNFFKKGSSLLDLFKHKQSNSLTSNQEVTSKCGIISEMSNENSDATENKLLAGFSPAQYWFTICPQKENSLETVHEGVQATPETNEKTTMRKWADTVTNQSIQTNTPCQSDHSCKPRSCDIEKCVKKISVLTGKKEFSNDKQCSPADRRCLATLENVFNEAELNKRKHKHKTHCECKREPDYFHKPTTKEPSPSEVADFILSTLLDNVMNAIQVQKEEQHTEREVEPSKPQRSNSPVRIGAVNQRDGLKSKNEDEISSGVRASDPTRAAKKLIGDASDNNSLEKSVGIINTRPIDGELEEKVRNEKDDKIEPIGDELEEKVIDEKPQETSKPAEAEAEAEAESAENIEEVGRNISVEKRSMEILEPAETISGKSRNKNKSAELVEIGRGSTYLKSNNDEYLKSIVTIAPSVSNKENFEKMLKAYEKEDNFAERLSMDDVFFEKELASIKSNNAFQESIKSVPSEEFISAKTIPPESVLITNDKKKRDKKKKFQQFFRMNKNSVKDIMESVEDDVSAKQMKGSLYHILEDDAKRFSIVPPAILKNKPSKSKDMRFEEEEKDHGLSQIYKKKTDCEPVELEDIGTCFARGFRPDNLSLSGDACFNFNKQDKYVLSPNMTNTGETIIDFSERQTPLDYLLALGFMVDEASNALKDEDIRSRLLAAITEARVWINKITTTQGTLLYLVSYKTHPKTMRYFLQLVEAIINNRINNAVKLNGFLKILERVEDGELQMINLLGADKFEDEENEEKIVKKQLRQLFTTVYRIAELEASRTDNILTKESLLLLRVLAAKYRAGLHPHLELIAGYIGQNLIKTEIQLEAAMIYLSRLDTADVKLKEFEAYCAIHCDKEDEENEH